MKASLAESNVTLNPILTIARSTSLEKHLLQTSSKVVVRRATTVDQPARVVERRHTQAAAQPRNLKPTKIPFGARGRKRQTLLFVGLQPNLAGIMPRKEATAGPSKEVTPLLSSIQSLGELHYSSDSE